jgi:hypothetical protein
MLLQITTPQNRRAYSQCLLLKAPAFTGAKTNCIPVMEYKPLKPIAVTTGITTAGSEIAIE